MLKVATLRRSALWGIAAALALMLPPSGAQAWTTSVAIKVRDAWSRPTAPGAPTGVGYLTLINRGAEDRLTDASTPLAASVSLHRSSMQGGVMSMQAVPNGLVISPGATVRLNPGGYHLMLSGLKRPLHPGDRVPLVLHFRKAGRIRTVLEVRAVPPEPMHMP